MDATIKFKETDGVALDEVPYIHIIGGGKYPEPTPENMTNLFKQIKGLCIRDELQKLLKKGGYYFYDAGWDDGEYIYTLYQNNYEPLILIIQEEVSYIPGDFNIWDGEFYHTEYHTKQMIKIRDWE